MPERRYICETCSGDLCAGSLRVGHPDNDEDEWVDDRRSMGWCWSCTEFVHATIPEPGGAPAPLPPDEQDPPDASSDGVGCAVCGGAFESGSVILQLPDDLNVQVDLVHGACWRCRSWQPGCNTQFQLRSGGVDT